MKLLSVRELEAIILDVKKNKIKRKIVNIGNNIFATVSSTNSKIPLSVRVKTKNKDTRVTIGNYPKMTLTDANLKASEIIKKTKLEQEKESSEKTVPIFRDAFYEWFALKTKQYKKGSTRPQNILSLYRTTIEKSGISELKINEINPRTISEKLSAFEQTEGNKHNAVSVMTSCLQYFYLKGVLTFNPIADLLKGRESPFKKPKAKGFKYIAPNDIAEKFLIPLSATSEVNRVFYLYLLLTGFRFGEVRLAHWSWFDFDKELIIIPPDAIGANKTQTEYIKPMTKQIKKLLLNWKGRNYIENCDYVFRSETTNKAICEGSFREPIKALTSRELDPHGIRKVMRSWMSSQDIPVKIAELALQHDVRSAIEKVYDKYSYVEEIREALQKWNDYIEGLLPQRFLELLTA